MKQITHSELFNLISQTRGATPVGILAFTDTKARKTNNPFGQIFKTVRAVGFVGANYENAVNREANRQGQSPDFQSEKLPCGQWEIADKVITHNGKRYLRTQTSPGQRRTVAAKVLNYRDSNGKFLAFADVKPFLPASRESNKQQEETGIEQTVWIRTYSFDSLQKVRINGNTYEVIHG